MQSKFTVNVGGRINDWDIWVYPDAEYSVAPNIVVTDTLDAKTVKFLEKGGNVLFTPKKDSIKEGKGGEITLGRKRHFA